MQLYINWPELEDQTKK